MNKNINKNNKSLLPNLILPNSNLNNNNFFPFVFFISITPIIIYLYNYKNK